MKYYVYNQYCCYYCVCKNLRYFIRDYNFDCRPNINDESLGNTSEKQTRLMYNKYFEVSKKINFF